MSARRRQRLRSRVRARAGMTLIEILISLAILSLISSLLYEGFVVTSRNQKRIEESLDRSHEIRMGMERIVSELQMAYTSAQRNPSEALRPMITAFIAKQVGDGTRIDFTSFSHRRLYRNAHESDQNELSYFVTNDPHKPSQRVLARREQRRIDNDPTRGGETQVLIENVKSFKVTFLEPLTTEWVETWDTTQAAGQANRLPSQAKIVLTVPNPSGTGPDLKFATRTYLPITYALNFTLYKP